MSACMVEFKDPIARDKAWARYYAKRGVVPLVDERKPTPGERMDEYLYKRELTKEQKQ